MFDKSLMELLESKHGVLHLSMGKKRHSQSLLYGPGEHFIEYDEYNMFEWWFLIGF